MENSYTCLGLTPGGIDHLLAIVMLHASLHSPTVD
jgi:hypothetical protein